MSFVQLIDIAALHLVHDVFACSFLDFLMPLISSLGNGGFIWIAVALLLISKRSTRTTGITMAAAMLICFIAGNLVLKNLVCRARPYTLDPSIVLLVKPSVEPYSFPSGHTMNAFSAAATLMMRHERFCWAAMALAVLIAFSRVYLMMHFPLDIVGGAIIGLISAYICCSAAKYYQHHMQFKRKAVK